MAQNLYSQIPWQAETQMSQPAWREEQRSSHANGETPRRPARPPYGSASTSTKRNKATSGQRAPTLLQMSENLKAVGTQETSVEPRAIRTQRTGKNLRVVETQRTGVDPRANISRSHLQDSMRTKGRTDNVWTSDDQARNTSGNVFRTRQEQERSQHFTA